MSFIRLKTANGEINLNTANVNSFIPTSDGGARITYTNGGAVDVLETCRAVRSAVKKLSKTSQDEVEAAVAAE